MSENCDVILIFQFMANLEQSLKNLQHNSHTIALSKGTIFAKNWYFFKKNADISKIKGTLVLKGIFSETTYVCLLTCQI